VASKSKASQEQLLQLRQFLGEQENQEIERILEERDALIRLFADREEEIARSSSAKIRAIKVKEAEAAINIINDLTQQAFDVAGQFIENEIIREEQRADKKLEILQKQFDDGIISQEEFESEKGNIEKDSRKKAAELQRKAAITEKAATLFGIAANTALGVTRALGTLPVPANFIVSGIIGALGAAQAAAVIAKPLPRIPSFQTGVTNFSGGTARINETGGEMVQLPGGSNVLTNSATKDLLFNQPNQSNVSRITNETTNNTTNNFNIDGVRDINDLRNELLRVEGSEAFT
jgi:hypothetical protein